MAEPRLDRSVPVRAAAPGRGADVLAPVSNGEALFAAPVHTAAKTASPSFAPSRTWVEDEPLVSTGRNLTRAPRPAPRVPRVPRQTTPAGAPSISYGDWTKPSRADEGSRPAFDLGTDLDLPQALIPPATTAIPERGTAARRESDRLDDGYDDYDQVDAFEIDEDHAADDDLAVDAEAEAGSGQRGRAAYRAQRQAADAARRKAAKRNGTPDVLFEDEEERKPRLVLKGLVAMVVVALAVLGVYTVTKPQPTQPVAATAPETTAPVVAPPTAELPPLANEPISLEPEVASDVRAPVTVLNATTVNGLAGKISSVVVAGGWESPGTGAYPGSDIPTTTVFFTEGDEQQRQAAEQLVAQFPELAGPAPRFFEVSGTPAPGLVIVATGNWQP
ncbi:LytR C-terminal domain-containing protein [Blastococcus saxobsidens]|uniref:LytR C-terminal domain-containing protein n=1 Tax=Blastococcus saxobsidens TaxID=138336 RepID=UPI00102C6830|nr:LytR C-terminal domain-containing protein [Blastococcus saxobsidens]